MADERNPSISARFISSIINGKLLMIVYAYREKKDLVLEIVRSVSNLEYFSSPREKDDSRRAIGFLTAYHEIYRIKLAIRY